MKSRSLEEEINLAFEKANQKERLVIHLQGLREQLPVKRKILAQLDRQVHKERKDVEKLEALSMASLFYQILGNKEQQLEKERQEYLTAFLQYENFKRTTAALEYEIQIIEEKLSSLSQSEYYLAKLLKQKERVLRLENPAMARQLLECDHHLMGHRSRIREIQEAQEKLDLSESLLQKLQEELHKVEHWGSYYFVGTGKYSTFKKKKYIELSRQQIESLGLSLQQLQEELYDVSQHLKIDYSQYLEVFRTFLEDFYDTMVNDWVVYARINVSQIELDKLQKKLVQLRKTLQDEIQKTNGYIEKEKARKEELIRKGKIS